MAGRARVLLAAGTLAAVLWTLTAPAAAQPTPTTPGITSTPGTGTTRTAGTNPLPPPATSTPSASAPPTTTPSRGERPAGPAGLGNSLGGLVGDAITRWFSDLAAGATKPVLDGLARSLLATPDPTVAGSRTRELWGVSAGLANSTYVLLVIVGGVLLMTHDTLQTSYTLKDAAPRLVVGLAAANLSLPVISLAIRLTNALSAALLGQGVDPAQLSAALQDLMPPVVDIPPGAEPVRLLVLVVLVVVVLGVALVGASILRLAVLTVLVVSAPLALATHALPQTEAVARTWWRALAACLGIQLGQAFTLITALRVFADADRASVLGLGPGRLVDLLVVAVLLWLLLLIPVWATRAVFGNRRSTMLVYLRSYAAYWLLRRSMGVGARGGAGGAGGAGGGGRRR